MITGCSLAPLAALVLAHRVVYAPQLFIRRNTLRERKVLVSNEQLMFQLRQAHGFTDILKSGKR